MQVKRGGLQDRAERVRQPMRPASHDTMLPHDIGAAVLDARKAVMSGVHGSIAKTQANAAARRNGDQDKPEWSKS
jgi:hypothetical protein